MNAAMLMMIIFGGFTLMFAGAYAFRRWGWDALAGAIPMLGVIIVVSGDAHGLVFFLSTSIITGCIVGSAIRYGKTMQFILIASAVSIATVSYGHYCYLFHAKKIDVIARNMDAVRGAIVNGNLPNTEKEKTIGQWEELFSIMKMIQPFLYTVIGALCAFLGYISVRYVIIKRGAESPKGIEHYRLNEYMIFPLIASIVVYAIVMDTNGAMFLIALNILLVLSFLYMLQGFGIFKFMLKKKRIPWFIILATTFGMLYFGLQAFFVFLICVAGFGALDLWADFRKLAVKGPDGGDDSNLN